MTTWMHARLEYNPCFPEQGTKLVIYHTRSLKKDHDRDPLIMSIDIDNEQLTELMVIQKITPVNIDGE